MTHHYHLHTLQHRGKYSDSIPSVTYVYMSANYLDDLAFAAAWLYRATGGYFRSSAPMKLASHQLQA